MCGINGILGIRERERLSKGIERMNYSLSHRGPDDSGKWMDTDIALGHQRLSILDLTAAGHQPMFSNDGRYAIVFNGEIYNFKSIKKKLPDYNFKSGTDTEVIIASFIKWGKECVNQFNGMFAFAIWDKFEKELFIARDRLGIKPLYYYMQEEAFLFSSEIRALLNSGYVSRKLNRDAVADYLRYQTVHAPYTMVENIYMLMPGHTMMIKDGNVRIDKYWDTVAESSRSFIDSGYPEVKKKVRSLLMESVERRLIADVPIGAFLSGGIDSSAIVGLMSEVSPGNVKTFSITFNEDEFSEAVYSRMVAEKFKTDHTEIRLTPDDFLNLLPEAMNAMDHPSGDGPNTYVVSKATREAGVTVALSGLGGDELFAGYSIFRRTLNLQKIRWLENVPHPARHLASLLVRNTGRSIAAKKIAEILDSPSFTIGDTYPVSRQVYLDRELRNLLHSNGKIPTNRVSELLNNLNADNRSIDQLSQVSIAEIGSYMQNVLLRDTDQMSMASALEVRVPFLDHLLVEYVLSLPDRYKYPSTPKKLMVDALGPLLPKEVVHRKKMGFTLPWSYWMKHELKDESEITLENLSSRSFFKSDALMNLWSRFLKGDQQVPWSRLWMLVVLEKWLEKNGIAE